MKSAMHLSTLPTPQVLVDSHRLFANIERAQQLADSAGLKLRPHAKTHKSPVVAKWQIERGAVGVCCAKVGEAEVFAAAGIDNIRLPYPVNPDNVQARFENGVLHLELAKHESARPRKIQVKAE